MNQQALRPDATDAQLALLARRGDSRAFSLLVERYRDGVVNMCYRLCGNVDLAQESTQEAFLRAWKAIDSYDSGRSFRNWLYRIAANQTIDASRREKPQANIELMDLPDSRANPEQDVMRQQRIGDIRRAVLALPTASRSVLVLREYEGMSYQEISETLDIPLGTVMSRLNYARTQLRKDLHGYLEEG